MRKHVFSTEHGEYEITEIPDFITSEECDALRALTEPRLRQSRVYSAQTDNVDRSTRISDQCWLYDSENHAIVDQLNQKIEKLTTIPASRYEALQVVRYQPGGFYKPHYDACIESPKNCERMNYPFNAQRYITVLVYLNDDYTGGETHFPKLPFTTRPQKGLAVLFYNCDATGNYLRNALHGGNPVESGEKWICNKWIHYPTTQHNFNAEAPRAFVERFTNFESKWSWMIVIVAAFGLLVWWYKCTQAH